MQVIHLLISDRKYIYDNSVITKYEMSSNEKTDIAIKERFRIPLEGPFVHYLLKELKRSEHYRSKFIKNMQNYLKDKSCLEIYLQPATKDLLDYSWNDRVYVMVREKSELDHALSWLSTLGGAFSALGDYFEKCAETAAKISINQLKLAIRLGDPQIAARCRLYFALSLIQRKRFKLAREIIYREYNEGLNAVVVDIRLLRMCKGIWAKLQYEHSLYVEQSKKCKIKKKLNSDVK
ncbi:hypothetical protein HHI36_021750 [Cryptolaemus montrouzieri]|uniref:Uncharacterized protein n=1 Tax=Cryptolaemus montrouzieri TaxID=559131 RepID=A0ABD2MXU2_9CUCU